jgi:trimethylamine--corrinoid protein Co-methyltransferase
VQAINALREPTADVESRVQPLRRGPFVSVLQEPDLERVLSTVRRILEDIGLEVPTPAMVDRLHAGGAVGDAGRVRLPWRLVASVLQEAPHELLLAGRDPACDLRVDGRSAWLTTGGPAAGTVDLETDERRDGRLEDLAAIARLADSLPWIGAMGPTVAALDIPSQSRPLLALHAQLANTSKHVQVSAPLNLPTADAMVEIGRIVAGSSTSLRRRPVLSAAFPIATPFTLAGFEAAIAFAQAGVPIGFVAAPHAGVTAPATAAGALVSAVAGSLAGAVCLQLVEPGSPTFLATRAFMTDVGGRPTPGGPQGPWFQMAFVQVARRLGLRAQIGAFATDAKASDWQAGMDGGLSATSAWMSPPDVLAAAGLRDGGRLFSPIAMLLDTELFDLVRQVPLGFDVDDEALAVDVIDEVGPGEHFLGEQHTLRHFRETWMARFMDTNTWEAWEVAGRPEPPEHAAVRAHELLASSHPVPLSDAAEERIREVIADHEHGEG